MTNGVRIYTAVNLALLISALAASFQLAYFAHRLTVKGGGMKVPRPAS